MASKESKTLLQVLRCLVTVSLTVGLASTKEERTAYYATELAKDAMEAWNLTARSVSSLRLRSITCGRMGGAGKRVITAPTLMMRLSLVLGVMRLVMGVRERGMGSVLSAFLRGISSIIDGRIKDVRKRALTTTTLTMIRNLV